MSGIYDKYSANINDGKLRTANVLCRFYSLPDDMIEKVCEATNTQLKIDLWDLRSNDDIQKIIEFALRQKDIEYRRKICGRKERRIMITDLAQWIYSCHFQQPMEAKNSKSKLFDVISPSSVYHKIFNEKYSLDEIINICNIAFSVKSKIKKIKKKDRTFEKEADFHFMCALFYLRNKRWSFETKFLKVYTFLEIIVKRIRRKYGKETSYNKIFTKMDITWKRLRKRLDKL